MLFNSPLFLFAFLPVTLLGFALLARLADRRFCTLWLLLASILFCAWWSPRDLVLLGTSIAFNHAIGTRLIARRSHRLLAFGVVANLALLAYFKYAGFLVGTANALVGSSIALDAIVLPLAISFYTFQQIEFLVHARRGEHPRYAFADYALFVTFFPHLIAGPIVRHFQMLPQIQRPSGWGVSARNVAVGLTFVSVGLFKKVVVADGIADYSTPVFAAASSGVALSAVEAWGGALAYSFQIYFDFSGYSDMAIGLARLFGIWLPINFDSPYKSTNIIEFWRRWHITLSTFLREHLYFVLGGNRKGRLRRYVNLMLVMLLGGLWHGAGWSFVIWGGLHGIYLVANHGWRALRERMALPSFVGARSAASALTFLAVVIAWVFFRASDLPTALQMLEAMSGSNGFGARPFSYFGEVQLAWLIVLALAVRLLPNSQEWLAAYQPALGAADLPEPRVPRIIPRWRLDAAIGGVIGLIAVAAILGMFFEETSEFLYFQF